MGLVDSILGAMSGKGDASDQAGPLIGVLSGLLAQSGGLQGLANQFSQSGQGDTFSSWVGMDENQSISSNQIQNELGSKQVKALAAKMGVAPEQASHFLADYLPKIVDKLTPEGKVDPTADPPTGFGQPASGALTKPRQQPKGDGANVAVGRVGRWPGAMTVIEIRPHRWGWKAFEAPGVEPVFPKKDQAIDYAQNRACFRSGEIHVLDSTGTVERTITFSEADRKL